MELSTLQTEYDAYWSGHNLSGVITNLTEIYSYFDQGGDPFSLVPPGTVLQPAYLYNLYLVQTGDTGEVSYSQLITWYSSYLQLAINEIQDNEKRLAALTAKSTLDSLFGSLSSLIDFFTSPTFWILIAILIFGLIILKIL